MIEIFISQITYLSIKMEKFDMWWRHIVIGGVHYRIMRVTLCNQSYNFKVIEGTNFRKKKNQHKEVMVTRVLQIEDIQFCMKIPA